MARRPEAKQDDGKPPEPAPQPSPPPPSPPPEGSHWLPQLAAFSGDVRTLLVNLTILLIIIVVVPVIGGQFLRTQVLIEPLSIPEPMLATGLTPEVAANRLWDGIQQVTREGNSAKGAIAAIPETQRVDFSIPDSRALDRFPDLLRAAVLPRL